MKILDPARHREAGLPRAEMSPRDSGSRPFRYWAAGAGGAGTVVSAMLVSRVLGYLRDMLMAWSLGAGIYADAFIVAFRLPNLFRRLVGEGALGMAFIPPFHAHAHRQGEAAALDLAARVWRRLTFSLAVAVLVALVFAPLVVRGLAPGFAGNGDLLALTVHLTRIMMPYVLLVGLAALGMAILNALGHFTAPALAPVALNAVMIAAIGAGVWLMPSPGGRAVLLAAGVVVGGALQLAVQVPVLRRHGFRFRPTAPLETGLFGRRFGGSALPVLLGGATYQINVLLGTLLASFLAAGSVSHLFYADRLVQFPLGLFAVSAVTIMMPNLSRQAADGQLEPIKETLHDALRLVGFVTLPAMVGLIVLREPIVALLFQRGAFGSDSTRLTSDALLWYSSGLWAYAALRLLLAVFYALQETVSPLWAAAAGVAINLGAGLGLMPVMGNGGIALAASLAAMVNVVLLALMLRLRIGPLGFRKILPAAVRIFGCALLMGAAVHGLNSWMTHAARVGAVFAAGRLAACIAAGIAVYVAAAFLCRSRELHTLWRMVYPRRQPS